MTELKASILGAAFLVFMSLAVHAQQDRTQNTFSNPPVAENPLRSSRDQQSDNIPVPDPTSITTEAIAALKTQLLELFGAKLDALGKEIDRIALELKERPADVRGEVRRELENLKILMDEKFKGVDQQFAGRDTALAAALLAQKTSVDEQNKSNAASATKSEVGFEKRIEGIATLIATQEKSSSDKITDLKDRLTAIESRGEGRGDVTGWIVAAAGFVMALLSIAAAVIGFTRRSPEPAVKYVEVPVANGKRA